MATRDNYQVVGNSLPELVLNLNLLLQRMADRIDKIEGIRGTPEMFATLDMNGNAIANEDINESPTFESITLSANLTVLGTTDVVALTASGTVGVVDIAATGSYKYTDPNGVIIHSFATIT